MLISTCAPLIKAKKSAGKILTTDGNIPKNLPIKGGWGYSFADAVILETKDSTAAKTTPYNSIELECLFVEKRIQEEVNSFCQTQGNWFGIRWNLLRQDLTRSNGRYYDVLTFEVTAGQGQKQEKTTGECCGVEGGGSQEANGKQFTQKKKSAPVHYLSKFYFDITSFFTVKGGLSQMLHPGT